MLPISFFLLTSLTNSSSQHFQLKLSHEHQGFVFEPSLSKAADLLVKHSGSKITTALKTAIEIGSIQYMEPEKTVSDEPDVSQIEDTIPIRQKMLPPAKEEKNMLDCFNCWK